MTIIIILNNVWQQQIVKDRESGRAAVCGVTRVRHDWATKRQQPGPGCVCVCLSICLCVSDHCSEEVSEFLELRNFN